MTSQPKSKPRSAKALTSQETQVQQTSSSKIGQQPQRASEFKNRTRWRGSYNTKRKSLPLVTKLLSHFLQGPNPLLLKTYQPNKSGADSSGLGKDGKDWVWISE